MDFANFTSIARNTSINATASRIALDDEGLLSTKKASFADKLGRAFRVGTPAKGSLRTNIAVRQKLAYSLGRELGLDTSDYGKLLKNLQGKLGKDVFDAKMFKDSGLWCGRPLTARRVTRIVNAAIGLNKSVGKAGADNGLLSRIGADEVADGKSVSSALKKQTAQAVVDKLATKAKPDLMRCATFNPHALDTVRVIADDEDEVQRLLAKGYKIKGEEVDTQGAFTYTTDPSTRRTTDVSFSPGQTLLYVMTKPEERMTNMENIMSVGEHLCTPEGALDMVDILQEAIREARSTSEGVANMQGRDRAGILEALDDLAARVDNTRAGLIGFKAGEVTLQTKQDLAAMIELFNLVMKG